MKLRSILIITLLTLSYRMFSQNQLGISKQITGFLDTVNVNQSVSYKVYIKNYGPSVFVGSINLNTWVDSTTAQVNTYHFSRQDILLNKTIAVGDSLLVNTGDTYDLSTYKVLGNGNVVVIWPIAQDPNWQTIDSAFDKVYVRYPVGFEDIVNFEKHLKIYPNPFNNHLFIDYPPNINTIEGVRVFNAIGEMVIEIVVNKNELNFTDLPNGLYTIEFQTNKGVYYKRAQKF